MTLGERVGNFTGSKIFWDHSCGRGRKGESGRGLYMAGLLGLTSILMVMDDIESSNILSSRPSRPV